MDGVARLDQHGVALQARAQTVRTLQGIPAGGGGDQLESVGSNADLLYHEIDEARALWHFSKKLA